MNDRFRFRAWDRKNKRMLYNIQCAYDGGCIEDKDGEDVEDCYEGCFDCFLPKEWQGENYQYIVEQCTGLKDKNGKLIYEGDIVDIFNWQHNKSQKGIVKYADNDACFGIFVSKMCYIAFSNIDEEYIEVIGNIHKNPELLEVEK